MAINLTDANYHDTIANAEGVSVVQFTAPWCGPCRMLAPRLEAYTAEHGITYYKVDIDQNSEVAKELRVMSIPTLAFYKDGEIRVLTVGVKSDKELEIIRQDFL